MRTEQIYYALMVEKCGSFSKAAELLYIKQQSVRMAINNLEDELGVRLFERTPKGVSLTEQGKCAIDQLRDILDIYEGLKFPPHKQADRKRILVGVNAFGLTLMSKTLDTFYLKYPHISIQIIEESHPLKLLAGLFEQRYDFVATSIAANLFEKSDMIIDNILSQYLTFRKLTSLEMGCFVKSKHPLANQSAITVDDLQKYLLVFPIEQIYTAYLSEIFAFDQKPNMVVSSNNVVNCSYIKNFQGIYISPYTTDPFHDQEIDTLYIPLADSKPLYLGFFYLTHSPNAAVIKKVIDFAEKYSYV